MAVDPLPDEPDELKARELVAYVQLGDFTGLVKSLEEVLYPRDALVIARAFSLVQQRASVT